MIKRFLPYYKPYLGLFILDLTSALFLSALDLVFPAILRLCIDTYIPLKLLDAIVRSGILLGGIIMARAAFEYILHFKGHTLGCRIEHDLRHDLFNHISKLSFTFFDNTRTGYIMSRVVDDLFQVVEVAHHLPENIFISTIMICGSIFILFSFNGILTLIILIILPVMIFFAYRYNRKMHKVFRVVRERVSEINAEVEDSISGIRVVQSFNNETLEVCKIAESNRNLKESRVNSFRIMAQFFTGINFFTALINTLVFILSALFVYQDWLTIGQMVGFLFYINLFLKPVRDLINATEGYQRGMAGFRRFVEIMDTEPDIIDNPGAATLQDVAGAVRFSDVSFSYNKQEFVLNKLNMSIKPGTTVALVGPSGAGKTTICNLIPRFYDVAGGCISIDGKDVREVTLKSLRNSIGIVQQDVFLFSGSVRDNIIYGKSEAGMDEVIAAAKAANAHEFILALPDEYDTYIGERGIKLSGGQKQRISIARMFLKNPPILILDEATSSLDTANERQIQDSIEILARGRTTFIIAHRLTTIRNADMILVLTEKGIEEKGSHKELLAREGIYCRLYRTQNDKLIV